MANLGYEYDELGRVISISNGDKNEKLEIEYDEAGNITAAKTNGRLKNKDVLSSAEAKDPTVPGQSIDLSSPAIQSLPSQVSKKTAVTSSSQAVESTSEPVLDNISESSQKTEENAGSLGFELALFLTACILLRRF